MILQALVDYYERMASDPDSGIAPLGWEKKELPYLIVLNPDGTLVQVEDTQETVGKKVRAKAFLVPQAVKRSSGIAPNLLWDNVEYVTGIVCKGKEDRVAEQHRAFVERLSAVSECASIKPVLAFLARAGFKEELSIFPAWQEACKTNAFVSFKVLNGKTPVFNEPDVMAAVDGPKDVGGAEGFCLVRGARDKIAELHPAIKGVYGTNTTGGNIVSFNFPAVESFGKKQGLNSPIGKKAAFEYTTALNTLLGKDSRQKLSVGDATMVFWSSRPSVIEDDFAAFFAEPAKDNPNRGTDAIERLLSSVETGAYAEDDGTTRFFVVGLSPNAARISVRFWHEGTVREMSGRFADWFRDLDISHGPKEKEHLSLWRLLVSTAVQGKSENISPHLAGDVMLAVLAGVPFPKTLLGQVVVRIKAEHDVTYPRAKLIKAALNRQWRFNNPNNERMITVSLDKENINTGYRLGRLFAALEKIQEVAHPGINATIRDKFYAAASSTPISVFGNLMRLKNHHLAKLPVGRSVYFEKLLGEIIYQDAENPGVTAFPAHLSLDEQGQFAIGYYHQRQDFFTKRTDADAAENANADEQV